MPTTPYQGLHDRIRQLNKDITEVLSLGLSGQGGVNTYTKLYNQFLVEAEELASKESHLGMAVESTRPAGVLIALKALTSQLKIWLNQNAPPGS